MILGIDASNLRYGGGVTHLVELLRDAKPGAFGFEAVIVWGGSETLAAIEGRRWLRKAHVPVLNKALPFRAYWQRFTLSMLGRQDRCGLLFVPGGSFAGSFRPFVTMFQNMLPFDGEQVLRYGLSRRFVRLMALRHAQSRTFRRADGVIFLTRYAQAALTQCIGAFRGSTAVVPHGIAPCFVREPRAQRDIAEYSFENPFRVLYTSIINFYKNQPCVIDAVARLRESGLPVCLDLVGPAYAPALSGLNAALARVKDAGAFIRYHGAMPYSQLAQWYHGADMFVFASSCENMPNILLEAMASGLPIASSDRGPMPEVLGDAGVYFDPEDPAEITAAMRSLIESPGLRAEKARAAYNRAKAFSWRRCADETFRFLSTVAATQQKSRAD